MNSAVLNLMLLWDYSEMLHGGLVLPSNGGSVPCSLARGSMSTLSVGMGYGRA